MRNLTRVTIFPMTALTVALAGCGGSDGPTTSAASSTSTSTATSTTASPTSTTSTTETSSSTASSSTTESSTSSSSTSSESSPSSSDSSSAAGAAGSSTADEKAVIATAETFLHAMGDDSGAEMCAVMTTIDGTKPLKGSSEESTCQVSMKKAADSLSAYQRSALKTRKVKSATVTGDTATVGGKDIEGGNAASSFVMPLVKVGGKWLIASDKLSTSLGSAG